MARAVISRGEGRGKSNLPESKLQRHLTIIRDAYQDYNRSFATFVKALAAAKKELGKDTLDKEIAAKLGISKATMSRHMTVAECEPLVERLSQLPKAMCALYPLARMREIHLKLANGDDDKANKDYAARLDRYSVQTKTLDIERDIKSLETKLSKKLDQEKQEHKLKRRDLILETTDKSVAADGTRVISWHDLQKVNDVFFTLLMLPDEKLQRHLNQEKLLESDVAERWSIARYRSPSQADEVIGLVLCQAKYLLGGIKLLHASGFRYHSTIVGSLKGSDAYHLQDANVLLLGTRGNLGEIAGIPAVKALDPDGSVKIAEAIGASPRLLIWQESKKDGWTSTMPSSA